MNKHYCNPLPLPNYPLGFGCRQDNSNSNEFMGPPCDFREAADPEVIYYQGKWFIFPSCGMAYVSRDFINWEHCPVEFTEESQIGYAPTVTQYKEQFLLTASNSPLYIASNPLGPYEKIGKMKDFQGNEITNWLDPMLFTDEDEKLYTYWGYGPEGGGIKGAEVDTEHFDRLKSKPNKLIDFDSNHKWERFGDANEHRNLSYVEGVSVFKRNSTYYLIYAACGTVFRNYALGCYKSKSPLGPFVYQSSNPIAHKNHGIVNGTGHGCLTQGPGDTVWLFYTTLVRRLHQFERRIAMDKCEFDSNNNLLPVNISEIPKSLSGNSQYFVPVTINKPVKVSSLYNNCFGAFAVDNQTNTWWEPAKKDCHPTIEIDFRGKFTVSSCRVMLTENGIDHKKNVFPVPVKFKLELFAPESNVPVKVIDKTSNEVDMLIEFLTFEEVIASKAKLSILRCNSQINHGINNITIFGY